MQSSMFSTLTLTISRKGPKAGNHPQVFPSQTGHLHLLLLAGSQVLHRPLPVGLHRSPRILSFPPLTLPLQPQRKDKRTQQKHSLPPPHHQKVRSLLTRLCFFRHLQHLCVAMTDIQSYARFPVHPNPFRLTSPTLVPPRS
jgi:hypothetical protein